MDGRAVTFDGVDFLRGSCVDLVLKLLYRSWSFKSARTQGTDRGRGAVGGSARRSRIFGCGRSFLPVRRGVG